MIKFGISHLFITLSAEAIIVGDVVDGARQTVGVSVAVLACCTKEKLLVLWLLINLKKMLSLPVIFPLASPLSWRAILVPASSVDSN